MAGKHLVVVWKDSLKAYWHFFDHYHLRPVMIYIFVFLVVYYISALNVRVCLE